jgi:hypothetical protein
MTLLAFAIDLALENEGDRRHLATEMFDFLLDNLPGDLDAINATSSNVGEVKPAGHKRHSAVRYCEVSRLPKVIKNWNWH